MREAMQKCSFGMWCDGDD